MHFARVQRDAFRPVGHDQTPVVIDPGRPALPSGPPDGAVEQRVARTECLEHIGLARVKPALQRVEQPTKQRLDRGRLEPERPGTPTQLGWEVLGAQRDVDPDSQHGPPLLGARLDQDAGDLAPIQEHIVGPLHERARAGRLPDRRHPDRRLGDRRLRDRHPRRQR